jgi:integrase
MKMRAEFRVPLSSQAVALLKKLYETRMSALIFPSQLGGVMAPMTVAERIPRDRFLAVEGLVPHAHGFRSAFANWSANIGLDFETTEKSLAHNFADATSRAYRRSDLFDQRREMLQKWADFLG